jgi:RNA polymerase sigma factor (sigma-70 family)
MSAFDRTKGTVFSWFRQQVRYRTLDWRRSHPATVEVSDSISEPEDRPAPDAAARDEVRAALLKVSDDDREILLLRSVEQLAHADIAMRLQISEDAARQRHKRAIDRLRAVLESEHSDVGTAATTKEG